MGQSLQLLGVDDGNGISTPLGKSKSLAPIDDDLDGFSRTMFAQEKKGKIADTFEMLEELGAGSFGTVCKGRDVRSDSFVAIKTIPKKKVKEVQKIKEEFNVIRQMDHPSICKAYECYEDRKNIYLVMELLVGGTLLHSLCRQNKFTEADASSIMRQVLSALAYLHMADFIFRDLKTENVMFTSLPTLNDERENNGAEAAERTSKQGLRREIKLIDFGLCCQFEKGSKLTKAAGTPYSVAPELITAPVQYDQKCDAWSAGVILYIMLSGKYPFNGKTKDELLHAIRKEPCSFASETWKRISKEVKTLLAELLRKKAEQRISVTDALGDPWLARKQCLPTEDILMNVVDSFNHFQNLNMFEKAAVTALAWRAGDEDTKHLREIFESLDCDGNGHITVQELRNVIESAGINIPGDLEQLAIDADTDGGGTIEYTEFLAATLDKQKVIKEEVIWQAFCVFDQDGSGTITKSELLKILTGSSADKIRKAHGNKAVDNFLDEYDASGDAVIDFDEFMDMLQGVKETYQGRRTISGKVAELSPASPRADRHRDFCSPRLPTQKIDRVKPPPEESSIFACVCPCSGMVKDVPETVDSGRRPLAIGEIGKKDSARSGTMNTARTGEKMNTARRGSGASEKDIPKDCPAEQDTSPRSSRRRSTMGRTTQSPKAPKDRRNTFSSAGRRTRERLNSSPRKSSPRPKSP